MDEVKTDNSHLWWFKGIISGEMDCEKENPSLIWTITLGGR